MVVRSSLVFLQQTLNLGLRISACPCQIFFCVVEFVLIEFELSLGNFELVAEIFLGALGSGGELSCEAGDQILVGFYYGVGLARAGRQFTPLRRGCRRMFSGLAQCVCEGEIDFVIGEPQSLMGEILLFRRRGQKSELAGGLQRPLIDCRCGLSYGFLAHRQNRLRALGQEQADPRGDDQPQQSNERDPLASLHHGNVSPRRVISE